jgi:hypothetical protein
MMIGTIPVPLPDSSSDIPRSPPLEPYKHGIDYHLLDSNPHALTSQQVGLTMSAYDAYVLHMRNVKQEPLSETAWLMKLQAQQPQPTVEPEPKKEPLMSTIERITYLGNWGGGSFSHSCEGREITVAATNGALVKGKLQAGARIDGSDSDHGHNYPWTFQDYDIMLESNPLPIGISLYHALKKDLAVYVGHLDNAKVTRFRPHRGTLSDAMAESRVILRSVDAIVDIVNADTNLNPFISRKVNADDLKFSAAGYDDRCQWDTVWVSIDGFGVIGCIDGPIEQ